MDNKTTEKTLDTLISDSKQLDLMYSNALNKGGKTVLKDLAEYCHEGESAYNQDARLEAFNLGVQSVMIYIRDRINGKFTEQLINIKEQEDNG